MTLYIELIIKILIAVALAVLFGNGIVVVFNHIPVRWFEDDGKIPEELLEAGDGARQRLTSTPWKYLFTGFFIVAGIYIALNNSIQFETAAICVMAVVLMMAVCDAKYMIVPDQFQILLAVSAIGFIGFYENWWEQLAGAAIGLILNLIIYALGRVIYKRDVIGGADLKFYACIGLAVGRAGVTEIFVLTVLVNAIHLMYLLGTKQVKANDSRPLLPYAFVAVALYFIFLRNLPVTLML